MTKIELLRRLAGLTQKELANRIGVSVSCIRAMGSRYYKPWPKLRRKVTEFFGYTEEELFDTDGWPIEITLEDVVGKPAANER